MTPPRSLTIVAVSSAVLVLFAGCGGDSRRGESEGAAQNPSTQTSPTPTTAPTPVPVTPVTDPARRAYVARVDRVCGNLDPERNSARERVGSSAGAQEAAKAYDDDINSGETELRQIEAIPVPPQEKQLVRTNIFDVIRRQLALRRQIRDALAAVDLPRLRSLRGQLDDLSRTLTGFARGYGFKVCGEN